MSFDMESIRQTFFEEANDLLNDFEEHVLSLESTPDDKDILNSIFRCAHSIKGGSATFGFPEVARFTHSLETLLDNVRNGQIPVTKSLCVLLLRSLDQMRCLLAEAKGETSDAVDSEELIAQIEAAAQWDEAATGDIAKDAAQPGSTGIPQIYQLMFRCGSEGLGAGDEPEILSELGQIGEVLRAGCEAETGKPGRGKNAKGQREVGTAWTVMLHCNVGEEKIREAFNAAAGVGELELLKIGGDPRQSVGPEETASPRDRRGASANAPAAASNSNAITKEGGTIKVASDKLDTLINLVGELVISQSMLNAVVQDFDIGKMQQLKEAVAAMERSSRELQERVMGIRLLQMKMAFGRFPRLVHDLSSSVGKKIDLKLVGEETELDKNLIEAIGDPLTHLVRNSVDHGLEPPEEREMVGKSPIGALTLSACHEGGSIVIEISDDGRGLNRDKILAKAVERGLAPNDGSLSDEQIYNLIFLPGFSTADQVTDLSGRGVGMDIVKQAINAIGGSIKVTSKPGLGCCTRIRLPLTMAILEGQSMAVGEGVYIVPLTSIVESLRPRKEDIHSLGQAGEVVSVRGEFVQVLRLYTAFNLQPKVTEPWAGSLVLVESEGRKVALMADELIGQGQVVIKSLETNYRRVDGIAGATILGDGRVALIVDVPGLLRGTGVHGGVLQPAA